MPQSIDPDLLDIVLNLESKYPRTTRVESRVEHHERLLPGLAYVPEAEAKNRAPLLYSYYGTGKFTSPEEALAALKDDASNWDVVGGHHLVIRKMPERRSEKDFEWDQMEYAIAFRFHVFGAPPPEPKK